MNAPHQQIAASNATRQDQSGKMTPMMAQYTRIKQAHPESLLFYRMGDFYEMFFSDAETAAAALGIALTKRGKHLGDDIPMCGVPVHAADDYLQKLIRLGHKVAVCEQTEDPAEAKRRGSKSVVRREVVRLVTPGTITEDNLLQAGRSNYLACLARTKADDAMALSWLDMSSGEFAVTSVTGPSLMSELARIDPSELLVSDALLADTEMSPLLADVAATITSLPASRFDSTSARNRLQEYYQVASLDAFGSFERASTTAAGVLLDYVMLTQVGRMPSLRIPTVVEPGHIVLVDAATRANLELVKTLSGDRTGSLLHTIDLSVTGPGGRLLAERLAAPVTSVDEIVARHDAVEALTTEATACGEIRDVLRHAPDMNRALARLSLKRGSPRDLAAVKDGVFLCARLAAAHTDRPGIDPWPQQLTVIWAALASADVEFAIYLESLLSDELPATVRDGGFIRAGSNPELDENRALRDESRKVIAGLQSRYAEVTGLKALKIRHNNMLGYFIELNQQGGEQLLGANHAGQFIHRQTMANAMRFTTTELTGLEQKISLAGDRARSIEIEIFEQLADEACRRVAMLHTISDALAELDVHSALSELAMRNDYTRPQIDASRSFDIAAGRHPVVEASLRRQAGAAFVPNDCMLSAGDLDEDGTATRHITLLTGPNMAGKSTYLRQNAIIALLAQMGGFVPAKSARIGVVDRIFSRVGAADDLARGRSTFMVEMVETATILNLATEGSLVILDEIGRGTATYDGLSIAWACVEHLHEVNRCRALFATHFHELTALSGKLERVKNATVKVREWQGEVIFLHEVAPGAADRSYGIQVARLAGLPAGVIERASEVLHLLEESERAQSRNHIIDDLPLFSVPVAKPAASSEGGHSKLLQRLHDTLPDDLSPREALDLVYQLKKLAVADDKG